MQMHCIKYLFVFLFCWVASVFSIEAQFAVNNSFNSMDTVQSRKNGTASFYSILFNGKKTSNGERLDNDAYTCAHPSLPFNTLVRVTNKKNGKSVIVRVTDRFIQHGKHLVDLTRKAATEIDMIRDGRATILLEVLTPEFARSLTNNMYNIERLEAFKIKQLPIILLNSTTLPKITE